MKKPRLVGVVCAVAPAIAYGIYNAVGARVREIPIRPDAVLKAMKS